MTLLERLLNLVDRTERKRLTPDEVAVLRAGIHKLAKQAATVAATKER